MQQSKGDLNPCTWKITGEQVFKFIPSSSRGGTRVCDGHRGVSGGGRWLGTGCSGRGAGGIPRKGCRQGVSVLWGIRSVLTQEKRGVWWGQHSPRWQRALLPVTPWLVEREHSRGSQSCHHKALAWEKERSSVLACHTPVTGSTNTVRHTEQCKSLSALTMLGTKAVTPLTQPLPPPTHAAIRNSSSPTAFISAQCVNNYLSGLSL